MKEKRLHFEHGAWRFFLAALKSTFQWIFSWFFRKSIYKSFFSSRDLNFRRIWKFPKISQKYHDFIKLWWLHSFRQTFCFRLKNVNLLVTLKIVGYLTLKNGTSSGIFSALGVKIASFRKFPRTWKTQGFGQKCASFKYVRNLAVKTHWLWELEDYIYKSSCT